MSDRPDPDRTSVRGPTDPIDPRATGRYEGTPTPPDPPDNPGHAAHDPPPDDSDGPTLAGRYKLVRKLGHGGMGDVWLAEQSEPVRRKVAVKLIRAGMDSRDILARFEAERQALSLMDHPHIARVFDAGTTPDGRPFFVMELVKGVPITRYCDEKRLTPRQRLDLFVPVCQAIQHAHQKGIIHRDIKPNNVLVTLHDDRPVPKVIDFGIAKATGQALTDRTLNTVGVVGTPEYMSPEQATPDQLDIDTRSDVYALGVLLYELLTGTTPVQAAGLRQKVLLEILRVVREVDAPRPSAYLTTTDTLPSVAAVRGTDPAKLTREFRGELDWIALKALEKDRARRYETANAFARDVQRYLADEVVEARPPSAGYRVRKFVRKHRGPVVAAALVLLALVGGAVGTVYGVIKADGERTANGLREVAEGERDAARTARDGEKQQRTKAEQAQTEAVAARDGEKAARVVAENASREAGLARDAEKKARTEVAFLNYAHTVDLAYREYQANNIARARELLESCPVELRGREWRYVHRLCHAELAVLTGQSAALSGDGRRVVTTSEDGTARVWDADTGKPLAVLQGPKELDISAVFQGDGRRVVTASYDNMAQVWDADTSKQMLVLPAQTGKVLTAICSPDGSTIWTAAYADERDETQIHVQAHDTRPARETFRRVPEAPPPRAVE